MTPETMILPDGSQVVTVHFLSDKRLACLPGMENLGQSQFRASPWIRTEETRSVNCPLCKETKEFKEAETNLKNVLRRKK